MRPSFADSASQIAFIQLRDLCFALAVAATGWRNPWKQQDLRFRAASTWAHEEPVRLRTTWWVWHEQLRRKGVLATKDNPWIDFWKHLQRCVSAKCARALECIHVHMIISTYAYIRIFMIVPTICLRVVSATLYFSFSLSLSLSLSLSESYLNSSFLSPSPIFLIYLLAYPCVNAIVVVDCWFWLCAMYACCVRTHIYVLARAYVSVAARYLLLRANVCEPLHSYCCAVHACIYILYINYITSAIHV
jgi:hypothetical protein